MKPLFFLTGLFILMLSCKKELIEKPENLIPAAKMENILYELVVLNGAKGFNTKEIKEKGALHETYIYEKYNVDSTQFANSSMYYSSKPEMYIAIYTKVEMRLKEDKKQAEEIQKINDSLRILNRDSLFLKRKPKDNPKINSQSDR